LRFLGHAIVGNGAATSITAHGISH
jgi:hypothetical protein